MEGGRVTSYVVLKTVAKPDGKEIIEFSAVLVNQNACQTSEHTFHRFCDPQFSPTPQQQLALGWSSEWNVSAVPFGECIDSFRVWLAKLNLIEPTPNFMFICFGDELNEIPFEACKITPPDYFRKWIDIKLAYAKNYKKTNLIGMLKNLNLPTNLGSNITKCQSITKSLEAIVNHMINTDACDFNNQEFWVRAQEPKQDIPLGNLQIQPFKFFVILDFEATCNENRNRGMKAQEIIEFPSVILNARTLEFVDKIQIFVNPALHPKLTSFCTELTGITQVQVDSGVNFASAFKQYTEWLQKYVDFTDKNFTFCICGDWDLKTMLPGQCSLSNVRISNVFNSWINVKLAFSQFYHKNPRGMTDMLKHLQLPLIGRHHSGIDDCINIARVVVKMLQDGVILKETWTSKLQLSD